jgi:biotin transport system substrate-specific component
MKAKNLIYTALFTALIAVGAFIRIPVPMCPFSLQTLFVALAGLILGPKLGALSALIYVLLGLVGVPVFTGGGGIGYFLKPSSGFLIAFIFGGFVTGLLAKKPLGFKRALGATLAGYGVTYLIALVYAYCIANFVVDQSLGVWTLMLNYFIIFIPSDIAKALVASYLGVKLKPVVKI